MTSFLQTPNEGLNFVVDSPNVRYSAETIESTVEYHNNSVSLDEATRTVRVTPTTQTFEFKTDRTVPRTGLMLAGWGGNNGTTVTAGVLANKHGVNWMTKQGVQTPNYWGSVTQASTVYMGTLDGEPIHVPLKSLVPMVDLNDVVIGGWDISDMNLGDAMKRAEVLDWNLQEQLYQHMSNMVPLPAPYKLDFIAANQESRANNVLEGSNQELVEKVRGQIRDFKAAHELEKVIVLWTANTERFSRCARGSTTRRRTSSAQSRRTNRR
jgi:myo-inositol-1-phosphate synthase